MQAINRQRRVDISEGPRGPFGLRSLVICDWVRSLLGLSDSNRRLIREDENTKQSELVDNIDNPVSEGNPAAR